ncbi:MAG: DUF1131 family protein [Cyanobacteria bacterium J06632_3]
MRTSTFTHSWTQRATPLLLSALLLSVATSCTPAEQAESTTNSPAPVSESISEASAKDAAKEAQEPVSSTESASESSETAEPAADSTSEPTAVTEIQPASQPTSAAPTTTTPAPASTPASVVLSESSIGALNGATKFDVQSVQAAFPGMTVTEDSFSAEGVTYPAIKVSADGSELLMITPQIDEESIEVITTSSPQVTNALGHEIGTSLGDIFTPDQVDSCLAGLDDYIGKAMCFAPGTQNIQYVFSGSDGGSTFGQLPSTEVLSTWTLTEIRWWSSAL